MEEGDDDCRSYEEVELIGGERTGGDVGRVVAGVAAEAGVGAEVVVVVGALLAKAGAEAEHVREQDS